MFNLSLSSCLTICTISDQAQKGARTKSALHAYSSPFLFSIRILELPLTDVLILSVAR